MDIEDKTETSSGSSDSVLRLTRPIKPSDETKPTLSNTATKTTKYKGIVLQQNGHWGAQIYVDHRRIWLGTFKTEAEAATAYDSASIKLRKFDANSHRNFPWNEFTGYEPVFQATFTTETVLNMIRDGSYPHKFREYLRVQSRIPPNTPVVGTKQVQGEGESNMCFACAQLFQKELTPSDVGKLNRLVIPKKYAVKYLPFINDDQNERGDGEKGGDVEDVEVVFYDRAMRQWKFRYCYWRSSQSFVFTRGWNGFVKEKKLKEKDVIVFYNCDVPSNVEISEGQSKNFLMIDVHYFSDNCFAVPEEANKTFSDNGFAVPEEANKTVHESSDEKEINFMPKLEVEEAKPEEKKRGFMLFGVRIQ
ncbi:unnamed protein product [Arabis nemorensis]|uniref:AP2/ERF and B3 domain-containing transcription factor n=1 Tax=Arabis nemorensis TaxID=586526 RepID=A0A565BHG8_9BRAS|nr:unnamed protein product [Arabis nemorensis]